MEQAFILMSEICSIHFTDQITLEAWVKSNSEGYIIAKDPSEKLGSGIMGTYNKTYLALSGTGSNKVIGLGHSITIRMFG
jgi:hypothetical protein